MTVLTLDISDLEAAGLPRKQIMPGETLFLEDDAGDCMYIVICGMVNIVTFGRELEDVGPGGVIGEVALIDDGLRSASAIAAEQTEVLIIDRNAFRKLVRKEPQFALDVMRIMAGRVRQSTPEGKKLSPNWSSSDQ